jgi:hypothetical protein
MSAPHFSFSSGANRRESAIIAQAMIKRARSPFVVAVGLAGLALLASGVMLHARAVRAESTPSGPGEDPVAAKAHFKSGKAYYDLGKYDEAIREFEAAYEAKNDPAFLFNLAQAHRLAGHPTEALHFYRTYLRYVPDPPNLSDIKAKMRDLEKAAPTRSPPAEVTTTPPPVTAGGGATEPAPTAPEGTPTASRISPPEPPTVPPSAPLPPAANAPPVLSPEASAPPEAPSPSPAAAPLAGAGSPSAGLPGATATATSGTGAEASTAGRRRLGKILTAVGGGTMLVGALFGLGARAESKSVESAQVFDPAVEKRGQSFESLQWVGYILGGITTGVGVYLLATNHEPPESSPVALLPLASPHVGGAMLRVSFR